MNSSNQPNLLVLRAMDGAARQVVEDALGDTAKAVYLDEVPTSDRASALRNATAVLSRNTSEELESGELELLGDARLLQFLSAGVDFIPLRELPTSLPIAFNGGGYAEPMAEHGVAMALAAGKRFIEHRAMCEGEFNQFVPNRMLAGAVAGILGFGGIGVACGRLLRGLGMKVHAVNRRGSADGEAVDWIGKVAQLDDLLRAADVLVLSLPLTRASEGLIGTRELELMKPDAIFVNLARGEIVDETALYDHLRANPAFTACIDAWWVEPVRHGEFRMAHDFLALPNVIASPHNSASTHDWQLVALGRAVENCRRVFEGTEPMHLVGEDERFA